MKIRNVFGGFVSAAVMCASGWASASPESLVVNGDFENFDAKGKAKNWYLPVRYRAVRGEGSNGSGGLVYENRDDPTYYQNASQRVDMRPGCVYRFGGWVKIDEISGKGGVALFVSWYDENGKYLGETQTSLLRKPTDGWVKLEGISKPVAANAAKASVATVVQRGVLGRIAFDKLYVERYVRKPVVGVYTSAYRREAVEGKVSFSAALTPEAFPKGKKALIGFKVTRPDGSVENFPAGRSLPDQARLELDIGKFGFGTNSVVCTATVDGREIGSAATTLVRAARPTPRKVTIDRYGRTVADGKLFFPLGMYSGRMTAEKVARYRESAFNCIMQYGSPESAEMELFKDAGLKVIFDIASQYQASDKGTNHVSRAIGKFGGHPSVLAWYIYDEKPTSMIPLLEARQRLVEALDPDHPTWCAQDIFVETRHYLGACDVFGGDPYPVSKRPVSVATDAMREETKSLMGMRPIWQVVQAFGWNWVQPSQAKSQRCPTEAEKRNMAWQAIAGGARGLVFYMFDYYCPGAKHAEDVDALWSEMKRISAEIKKHERVLLFADTVAIPDADLPKGVVGRFFREDGETWRLLVNTTDKPVHEFGLPPFGVSMIDTDGMQNALLRGEADRTVAFYKPGEEMVFTLRVDGVERPFRKKWLIRWSRTGDDGKSERGIHPVEAGPLVIRTSLDKPGFVRIKATVVDEKGVAFVKTGRDLREAKYVFFDGGAGVEPEKLKVCVPEPEDFDAFWARHKAELAKVPLRADLREYPGCGAGIRVYAVSIDCAGPRPATGFLTVPAKPGKYPARITLHGYGNGPAYSKGPRISGHANCIGFDLNAHGYEIGREKEYYDRFFESIRSNGMSYGFDPVQNRDPEQCYFSGMTYRLMRALEYIKSLPEWDGKNLTAHGGSQGGLQSVWAAALDPDVSVASVGFPWLCDMSGKDLGGRIADGWRIHWSPGLGYYDPVNLAKRIGRNCRVNIFRAGLGDYCCPRSGVAALYNAMTCPKRITWVQGSTHNYAPPAPNQKFVLSEGDWDD